MCISQNNNPLSKEGFWWKKKKKNKTRTLDTVYFFQRYAMHINILRLWEGKKPI